MKKLALLFILATAALSSNGQAIKITFSTQSPKCETYYVAQHFRDKFITLDSIKIGQKGNTPNLFTYTSSKKWDKGVYALLNDKHKKMFDFVIDDNNKFNITFDEKCSNEGMRVKGSQANQVMYEYMAKMEWARARAKELSTANKDNPEKLNSAMEQLTQEMKQYEGNYMKANAKYRFTQLLQLSQNVDVPEHLPAGVTLAGEADTSFQNWQAIYYRSHYWDNIDFSDHSLIYTPQLFDKMNYYFFGLLYYQASDTISRYADMVLHKIENDSTMMRYFLEYITPKYERATKNIGWDQVFVNLVQNYYLQGKCPWATESEIFNKRNTIQYLSHSLIGAIGAELRMADTNQSPNPNDWISSHRFPERYVILWFWDPDCHHCQEQSEDLKKLYDSLLVAGNKRFEVYAIGYEADVTKWKQYIEKHQFPFVNVGGNNVNIDYQEAYNIHGAPTMIILDADRRIIMNKTLPIKNILPFLDRYEAEHPDMATKITHWMR